MNFRLLNPGYTLKIYKNQKIGLLLKKIEKKA